MSQPSTRSLRELIAKWRRRDNDVIHSRELEALLPALETAVAQPPEGLEAIAEKAAKDISEWWCGGSQTIEEGVYVRIMEALCAAPSTSQAVAQARVDAFCTIARDVQNQFDAADGGPTETRVALASVLHLIAARRTVMERDLAAIAKEPVK